MQLTEKVSKSNAELLACRKEVQVRLRILCGSEVVAIFVKVQQLHGLGDTASKNLPKHPVV